MKIDIAAISVDMQNFRHDQARTEREAIRFLLSNEKTHKVAELARDIVEQEGLDPSSLLIVVEDPNNPGQYIALEGNRRITALKALMTPDLADGTPGHATFKSLHAPFLKLNITTVECVVLNRNQAAIWIKRKHYKGMGGAGVVAWNAVATARSDAAEGRFTRWMTALAYLEKHGVDAEEIRDSIASKTTTVERVLASSYMSSVLGLTFGKGGSLIPENADEAMAANLIHALLEAMSERSFIEPKVSDGELQLKFISGFTSMSVKKPAAPSGTGATAGGSSAGTHSGTHGSSSGGAHRGPSGGSSNGSNSGAGNSTSPSGGSTSPASSGIGGATKRSKPVKIRKTLADSGLRISNPSLNKFYSELRKVNVEKNPHIAASIIRVFLEKASTVFLETMKIPPLSTKVGATWQDFEIKLKTKIDTVLKHIDPAGNNPKLVYARDVANGNRDKSHTADHLNQAIHSHHALPAHTEIITIWDRFHPYFLELFETIENQGKP